MAQTASQNRGYCDWNVFDATRVQFTQSHQVSQDFSVVDVWPGAQNVSKSVNDYLGNISPPGEPHTSVAVFNAIPEVAVIFNSMLGKLRDAAFEVRNVELLPATTSQGAEDDRWQVGNVLLSHSSSVNGAAVTVSVVTGGNGIMALRFRWQEGVFEDGLSITSDIG